MGHPVWGAPFTSTPNPKEATLSATDINLEDRMQMMRQGINPDEELGAHEKQEMAPQRPERYWRSAAESLHRDDKLFHPLEEAADEYIQWSKTPEERAYMGVDALDVAMRGIAPGEFCMVVGYVHSGKTVLVTQVLLNNPDQKMVLFTPDETRVLVLIKLASMVHNMSAQDMERAIANGDTEVEDMIRNTARERFPNLAVFDDSMTISKMDRAIDEVSDHWGESPKLVIFDYADLLVTGDDVGGDTRYKMGAFKNWTKERRHPLMLLHQSSRTAGSDGAAVTIDSGGYGGEAQSTFVIGVRRKKNQYAARLMDLQGKLETQANPSPRIDEQIAEARYMLEQHQNTITWNLVKNKRPPGALVDDLDYYIDPLTGHVRPLDGLNPLNVGTPADVPAHPPEEMF